MTKKLIGKGHFSRCYLNSDGETVTIVSRCTVKQAFSDLGVPESSLFVPIEQTDVLPSGKYKYIMEYLPWQPLKNLKPDQREFYDILRGIKQTSVSATGYVDWFKCFSEIPDKFSSYREDLLAALGVLSDYDAQNVCFEISPRNIRIKNGNLVLLDCFFFTNEI